MDKQHFLKRIEINYPDNFKRYDYELLPAEIKATDNVTINCFRHGLFSQKAISHLTGKLCVKCGREKSALNRKKSNETFISEAKIKFGERFDYSRTVYKGKGNILEICCPTHNTFETTPDRHLRSKYGCPKCDYEIPRASKRENVLSKARKVHSGKYLYNRVVFRNMNDKVEIICPKHGIFHQNLNQHVYQGHICPKCSVENGRLTQVEFIEKANAIHGSRYDYSNVIYTVISGTVEIICKKHGPFMQRAGSHLQGNGCRKCFIEASRSSRREFIDKSRKIHGDLYNYDKVVYKSNKVPVELVCKIHGNFRIRPDQHLFSRQGCKLCNSSKGETAISNYLTSKGINFIREFKISPYLYRYDFMLKDLNLLIEYHGIQHYKPTDFFGGEAEFNKRVSNDKVKVKIARESGYRLLVIPYTLLPDIDKYLDKHLSLLPKVN